MLLTLVFILCGTHFYITFLYPTSRLATFAYIVFLIYIRSKFKTKGRRRRGLFHKNKERKAIPAHVREAVFRKYDNECAYCGSSYMLEVDHIYPYSKGGSNSIGNLQLLCRSCNRSKSDKILVGVRKR